METTQERQQKVKSNKLKVKSLKYKVGIAEALFRKKHNVSSIAVTLDFKLYTLNYRLCAE